MPDPMLDIDKDKDLQPVRPPVMVTDRDEKALQLENPPVELDTEQREMSPREMIYKKHDELQRPTSAPLEVHPEELDALAEDESNPISDKSRQKPGPKAQVEVTVNGVTRKVDKTKVDAAGGVEAYQMMVAGQEKLRLVAQRQRELDDREADIKRRQKELDDRELAPPKVEASIKRPDLAAPAEDQQSKLRRQANDALLDGDTEESARLNALADENLVTLATNNAVRHVEQTQTQKEAARLRDSEIIEARQREAAIAKGTAEFAIEFPEIMSDANLFSLADEQTVLIAKEHPDWTPSQVIHQAGRNVSKWVSEQGRSAGPSSLQLKAQEKRSMGSPNAGSMRSPRKPEPKQQTSGDYVLELQRKRGQITY